MDLFEAFIKIGIDDSGVGTKIDSLKSSMFNLGDAIKANIISDAIKSGITFVIDGLEKMGKAALDFGKSSLMSAVDYESAFAGVKKTVDATEEEYAQLSQWIKKSSTELGASKQEIAGVMEVSGQLGISGVKDLETFTDTMIKLGMSTNLSSEEAATAIARIMNITGESTDDADKLGAVIVALGNNFATTESEIVNMATRLASTGTISGLTSKEVFALSTAMSSVGIQAEAGGTAMTQTLTAISQAVSSAGQTSEDYEKAQEKVRKKTQALEKAQLAYEQALKKGGATTDKAKTAYNNLEKAQITYNEAVKKHGEDSAQAQKALQSLENAQIKYDSALTSGSEQAEKAALRVKQAEEDLAVAQQALEASADGASGSLGLIAEVSGMSAEQFAETWKNEPMEAIQAFIGGLGNLEEKGMDINGVLDTLKMDGVRQGNMLKSLSLATEQLSGAVEMANEAYGENAALNEEVEKRQETTAVSLENVKNAFDNIQESIGAKMKPTFNELLNIVLNGLVEMDEAFNEGGFPALFEKLQVLFNNLLAWVAEKVIPGFATEGGNIVDALINGIGAVLDTLSPISEEIILRIGEYLGEHAGELLTGALSLVLGLGAQIIEHLGELAEPALQMVTRIAEGISENAGEVAGKAVDIVEALALGINDNKDTITSFAESLMDAIQEAITEAAPRIIPAVASVLGNLTMEFALHYQDYADWGAKIIEGIAEGLGRATPSLLEVVAGILLALWQLPVAFAKVLFAAVKGFFTGLIESVKDLLGIHSPSKVFEEIGDNIIQGLINGITGLKDSLINASEDITGEIQNVFGNAIDSALGWGEDLISNFVDGIKSGWSWLINGLGELGDLISDYIGFSEPDKGPLSKFHTYAPDMMQLFAQGIKDNEKIITDQLSDSFNFEDVIKDQRINIGSDAQIGANNSSNNRIVALLEEIVSNGIHSDIELKGDAEDIFSVVRRKNYEFTQATGYSGI